DAGGHGGFERLGSGGSGRALDEDGNGGGNGGAVDEEVSFGVGEKAIVRVGVENVFHGVVIGNDGDNDVGKLGDAAEFFARFGVEFIGDFLGRFAVDVVNGGDFVMTFFETASHVGAHAADADDSNFFFGFHDWNSGKKGLCCFSCATVVTGPWPGQRMVWSGSVRIFWRLLARAS